MRALEDLSFLGVKSPYYDGSTMIASGSSVSGFAYYVAELFGGPDWNPPIKYGKSTGKVVVRSIFGDETGTDIVFREITLEKLRQVIRGIDTIGLRDPIFCLASI